MKAIEIVWRLRWHGPIFGRVNGTLDRFDEFGATESSRKGGKWDAAEFSDIASRKTLYFTVRANVNSN
jgi:hypothetical protein